MGGGSPPHAQSLGSPRRGGATKGGGVEETGWKQPSLARVDHGGTSAEGEQENSGAGHLPAPQKPLTHRALPVCQNGPLPGLNPLLPDLIAAEQMVGERRAGVPVTAKEAGVPPAGREEDGPSASQTISWEAKTARPRGSVPVTYRGSSRLGGGSNFPKGMPGKLGLLWGCCHGFCTCSAGRTGTAKGSDRPTGRRMPRSVPSRMPIPQCGPETAPFSGSG